MIFPSTLSHNACTHIHTRMTFTKTTFYPNLPIPSLAQEKDKVLRERYSHWRASPPNIKASLGTHRPLVQCTGDEISRNTCRNQPGTREACSEPLSPSQVRALPAPRHADSQPESQLEAQTSPVWEASSLLEMGHPKLWSVPPRVSISNSLGFCSSSSSSSQCAVRQGFEEIRDVANGEVDHQCAV